VILDEMHMISGIFLI